MGHLHSRTLCIRQHPLFLRNDHIKTICHRRNKAPAHRHLNNLQTRISIQDMLVLSMDSHLPPPISICISNRIRAMQVHLQSCNTKATSTRKRCLPVCRLRLPLLSLLEDKAFPHKLRPLSQNMVVVGRHHQMATSPS